MAQIELELGVQRAVVGPLARGLVELDVPHVIGDQSKPFGVEQSERLLFDLREWCPVCDRLVEKQVQDLPSGFQISAGLCHGFYGGSLGRELGLLFVLTDEMDEGLDQVVVDLAKAMKGKTQQVHAGRRDG